MAQGIRLKVAGAYACFTRPEMKVERVSYDVMTPSAARGILEAIHWKPAIRWMIDFIHVLKTVRFTSIRRNEVSEKIKMGNVSSGMKGGELPHCFIEDARQQRAAMVLRDVSYLIEAHFEMTDKAGSGDNPGKHLDIFNRRAASGQCFHQPCLGCREFPAQFTPVAHNEEIPTSDIHGERDLGWMLYDIDFTQDMTPRFFRPVMVNGVIDVQKAWKEAQ
ncbi:MAG: type I-C CRISPR-associated protein Cas5c [Desulfovibrio sp.]|jgi:CRISPR-associated protein Cas5d|nr:type I-C CRISPR-associated protein Cas5c [Desulfovibrio sp.]